jgi:glucose/arabinose dehydrogenase
MIAPQPIRLALFLIAAFAALLAGCGGSGSSSSASPPPTGSAKVALTQIASGLSSPIDIEQPDDASGRLFVVEQAGTIRILTNGSLATRPFLDIRSLVSVAEEMGLLGVAFHPNFASSGRLYVNYVRTLGNGQIQTVISEFQVSATDPNQADPNSERILLTVDQPFGNHKGGQLVFGPDGFLYIGLGDGGSGGDPLGNGQSLNTLLGKMLRIDVDSALPYAVPPDNPFASGGGLPEIFAYGLRNPWRFSFDRASGQLFVGDVGQDAYEEIDIVRKGGNYGWNTMEGLHCFNPASGCNMNGLTLPIVEYDHSEGEAVIGGFVYHGGAIAGLNGAYIFGDFISGKIWQLTQNGSTWQRTLLLSSGRPISSFGQDRAGELYVADYSAGSILKLTPQ